MSVAGTKWALLGGLAMTACLGIAAAQFNSSNPNTDGQLQQLDRGRGTDEPPFIAREIQERQLKRLRQEHHALLTHLESLNRLLSTAVDGHE